MTIAKFARWSGLSRSTVERLIKGRVLPYTERGGKVRLNRCEVVECIRDNWRINPSFGHIDVPSEPGDAFPFVKLREYARESGRDLDCEYMRLYRQVENRQIPYYRLKGTLLIDPIELGFYLSQTGRVSSIAEISR